MPGVCPKLKNILRTSFQQLLLLLKTSDFIALSIFYKSHYQYIQFIDGPISTSISNGKKNVNTRPNFTISFTQNQGFLAFSRGIEWERWPEMGYDNFYSMSTHNLILMI